MKVSLLGRYIPREKTFLLAILLNESVLEPIRTQPHVHAYNSFTVKTNYPLHNGISEIARNSVRNEILLRLPAVEREAVFSRSGLVRLSAGCILHEPHETVTSAYFCNAGLISLLTVFYNGKTVEGGLIGRDGFIGVPLIAGFRTASTRAVVLEDATAFRIDGPAFISMLKQCPHLERLSQQFSQLLAMQVTQIAACARLHQINQRLARWLLISADKARSTSLQLTHEVMAQVLGTRRSSITVASETLEKAGAIVRTRGGVEIISRILLEKSACECYAAVQRQYTAALNLKAPSGA